MNRMEAQRPERYGAFLLYVDDWLSSTAIDLMSAAEERGYLRLLMHAWKSPDCGLPANARTLAQLSKLGATWHGKSGAVVRAQFVEREGRLFNERLLREREHQRAVRLSRSNASRKANESRWGALRNPSRISDGSLSDPNSNPSPRKTSTDLDYAPSNRQDRDSTARDGGESRYPQLRETLRQYMQEPGHEDITPTERLVVDVMDAAGGAAENDVIACLEYLREGRGLKPGTRYGPRHWSWFKTVISHYFRERRERAMPTPGRCAALSAEEFKSMTDVLEIQAEA